MPEEEKKRFILSKTQVIISIICGLMIITGSLYGLFKNYDNSLVHMIEYKAFKQQVNEQTLQQRIDFYQRIVWDLEVLHKTINALHMENDIEKYRTAAKNLDIAAKQLASIQGAKEKP